MPPSRAAAGPSWLGLVLLAMGSAPQAASALDDTVAKDWGAREVRRVEKVHVTTEAQLFRRAKASSTCPADYSLCPLSMSGGCCPTSFACEPDSCVQTTIATTVSACGIAGYINCGLDAGGGCCPSGYVCGVNSCTASTGISSPGLCPTGYKLCPASYNYGCCPSSMGCALNACFATASSTYVFTSVFPATIAADGKTSYSIITSTSVGIPTAPTGLPTEAGVYLPKFVAVPQAKVQEEAVVSNTTSNDSSSGLTSAQIGGLVGGLVGLLLVILVASFFIIRNLRKTVRAVKRAERNSGSSGARRSGKGGGGGGGGSGGVSGSGESGVRNAKPRMAPHLPTPSEVNRMEYDDLLEGETVATQAGIPMTSTPSHAYGQRMSNTTGASSPAPDPHGFPKASLDYSSPGTGIEGAPVTGYFDIPTRAQNRPGRYSVSTDPRTSIDSQGQQAVAWQQMQQQPQQQPYHRPRVTSDASERSAGESAGMGSPLQPAELGVEGGYIPELPSALHSPEGNPGDNTQYTQYAQYQQYAAQSQLPQRASRPFSNISALSGMSTYGASAQAQQQQYQQQQQPFMGHSRNWSDDSNNGTPNITPGHTPGQTPGHTPGNTPSHSRDRTRDRSNSYQQLQHQQPQAPKLDVVSEVAEHMHGHYGPMDTVAGQTRSDADVEIDISSPVVP
ncbi:hypothetical protein SCUCBS95973_007550 [Sporothrix curviconia]|uniref:Uncharacterized protein n=1 Tax=Sporothrix curviconia TaxID=1260050 RepID=A0ABP0CFF5_9PEZI